MYNITCMYFIYSWYVVTQVMYRKCMNPVHLVEEVRCEIVISSQQFDHANPSRVKHMKRCNFIQ